MRVSTGFVTDPIYLLHRDETGSHPECPERLRKILDEIQRNKLSEDLIPIAARKAEENSLARCHTSGHIDKIKEAASRETRYLDADTFVNPVSFDAALTACGGVMAGIDGVMSGKCSNIFCAVRPPGHHAESDKAMGFCLLNNVAVGARYAQEVHGLKKIFILDWDVHHGNGTQEIFYEDDTVFYFSIHQFPLYPGTGRKEERGKGSGKGFTYNIPVPAGYGDHEYLHIFQNEVQASLSSFRPDLILISAGFDAHREDPLAQMDVSTEGFADMTHVVKNYATRYCDGRLVSVLEGGYHLTALADSVSAHLRVLMHD